MEPPAKRLRILQSIEVDDTNPDYIAAKEKQRAKLKGRFESLYAKYEALPEAMTDEIDMRTGEIVVDRGHMRRLNQEYLKQQGKRGRRSVDLLDDLFRDEADNATDDDESAGDDGRDELAPSQSPEPRSRKQHAPRNELVPMQDAGSLHYPTVQPTACMDAVLPYGPAAPAITSSVQAPVPNASSPAASWMQMVQFPQTPAGQMAQSAFMQQIQQAVQQAITPILSNMLSVAPLLPQPDVNAVAIPSIPTSAKVGAFSTESSALQVPLQTQESNSPTTLPSSPLPPASSDVAVPVPSSPLPPRARSPHRKRVFAKGVYINTCRRSRREPQILSNNTGLNPEEPQAHGPVTNISQSQDKGSRRQMDDNAVPKRRGRKKKAPAFGSAEVNSMETDVQTMRTEKQLRQPISKRVRIQARKVVDSEKLEVGSISHIEHLPTPDSLEHDDIKDTDGQSQGLPVDDYETLIASGGHFDDDERDLLSIGSGDDSMADVLENDYTAEDILPSIETDLPEDLPAMVENTVNVADVSKPIPEAERPHFVKLAALSASSPIKPKKIKPSFRVESGSEDELDLVANSPSTKHRSKTDTSTNRSNKTQRRPMQANPVICVANDPLVSAPSKVSGQDHNNDDDELLTPKNPQIKRESCTPPLNFLLATPTVPTPRSAPQLSALQSSGSKTNVTPLARSVFLKRVKQSWARGGLKNKPRLKGLAMSKDVLTGKRKRAMCEDDDSGDELAL